MLELESQRPAARLLFFLSFLLLFLLLLFLNFLLAAREACFFFLRSAAILRSLWNAVISCRSCVAFFTTLAVDLKMRLSEASINCTEGEAM